MGLEPTTFCLGSLQRPCQMMVNDAILCCTYLLISRHLWRSVQVVSACSGPFVNKSVNKTVFFGNYRPGKDAAPHPAARGGLDAGASKPTEAARVHRHCSCGRDRANRFELVTRRDCDAWPTNVNDARRAT
jgi:hypothetical protein